jgi:tetratricopeptide (TPR) repeat protein
VPRGFDRISPEILTGGTAAAAFAALTLAEGGTPVTSSAPAALFLVGLAAVVGIAYRLAPPAPRAAAVAWGCLAAFTLWSFASIAWAESGADAWEAANRCVLYLAALTVFLLPAWRSVSAAVVVGAYSVAIAAIALGTLIAAAGSADPALDFIDGRLTEPTGYQNATAVVFALAAWPALFLAGRREVHSALRPPLLAAAGVLLEVAVLPQSRGAAAAALAGLVAYLIAVPNRPRALPPLLVVGCVGLLAGPTLIDTLSAVREGGDAAIDALDASLRAVLVSAGALLALGGALVGADLALSPGERATTVTGRAVDVALAALAVVASVGALAAIGNPVSWAEERWDDFRAGYEEEEVTAANRFTSGLGSNRYDFWRVALEEFGDHPVAGLGAGGFETAYLRERESLDEPRYAHSLELEVLAEMGLVGTLLLGAALAALIGGALAARLRAADELGRGIAACAIVAFVTWGVAASVDWIWQVPAATAPVLAWLAVATRLRPTQPGDPAGSARATVRLAASAALALLAAVTLTPPWLAARKVDDAAERWRADLPRALEQLAEARDLNPLSGEPDAVAGAIAVRAGEPETARDAFSRAVEREPENWYARLQLAVLAAAAGDRDAALEEVGAAAEANPREPLIQETQRRLQDGEEISSEEIDAELLGRVCTRIGRTGATRFCE